MTALPKSPRKIVIYHSPDSDDAFMFYGLTSGAVNVPGYEFDHDLSDIESLNQRTLRGELEVTAVSVHAYAHLGGKYLIMRSGASMGGKNYGPKLVVNSGKSTDLRSLKTIAIPGEYTSAALALKLFLKGEGINVTLKNIHFDQVQHAVKSGEVDAGIIIHEGQLTHEKEGLTTVVDLGVWWWNKTKLPLPLGVNVVRKDIGPDAIRAASIALSDSIEYSLAHRKEALKYALKYGRGISEGEADTFVGMYVNELTRDLGATGEQSIRLFLSEARLAGLVPQSAGPEPEFVQTQR